MEDPERQGTQERGRRDARPGLQSAQEQGRRDAGAGRRRAAGIAAVAALDEPTRRQVYDLVAAGPEPMSRDEVAEALDLPRTTAAFHLERLAACALLDVVFERRTGRSGPGAGRPAKLYRRAACDVAVSVPERHYDLAGRLLAGALQEAERSGESPRAVLERQALRLGRELGREHDRAAGEPERAADAADPDAVLEALRAHGYEPGTEDGEIVLRNCPFHLLAREHTELVCGMNLHLLDGLLRGLGAAGLSARLAPAPGLCCVRLRPAD
ncbi:helix-turn-helix transcriptional regulator [Planobispora takensis]|uniref:ArsR family transcriptional regulator n=1 Tax=Planobispora takensis TaxID=1367882 RepID=A0A8J3T3Y9_9ACTN|nr:helix-turn-helix domain-containing protein [Planobispora takensis]GII05627.1 ArsR family transcriptional regulator [Planobispora takensis]